MDIPEGSRFVSPDNDLIIYEFIGKNDDFIKIKLKIG